MFLVLKCASHNCVQSNENAQENVEFIWSSKMNGGKKEKQNEKNLKILIVNGAENYFWASLESGLKSSNKYHG